MVMCQSRIKFIEYIKRRVYLNIQLEKRHYQVQQVQVDKNTGVGDSKLHYLSYITNDWLLKSESFIFLSAAPLLIEINSSAIAR